MKKKVLVLVLAAIMLVALGIGGTLAWLKDTKTVTNTFSVGDVEIGLTEPAWVENSKILPGATIPKDPTVTVEANSENSFVFVKIVVAPEITALNPTLNINANWIALPGVAGVYYYNGIVPTAGTDTVLPKVFTTITIPETVTDVSATAGKTITVNAYAVQASAGGETGTLAQKALAAWNAASFS